LWIRFIVQQKLSKSRHTSGLFMAAQHLQESGELSASDSDDLEELLEWFRLHLPLPPNRQRHTNAIYWYNPTAKQHIRKMWQLARLLEIYGYTVELVTSNYVGLAVYQDEFQVGAILHTDRHR
jgi:hypothetical protein